MTKSVSHSVVSLQPQDCSLPGSSHHWILQARILVWVAYPFTRGSSWPRDQTQVSFIAHRFFAIWATREQTANIRWIIKKAREFQKNIYFGFIDYAKALTVWITTNCGKFLKEIGIPEHLTWLLRNLYAGQEAIVRTGNGTIDWFQIGKGVHQGCILSLCLLNFYAEYIMWNAGLDES